MKLKTYTAETMAQALAQVRKDLGKEAMILHTRSYRVGSWLGIGGRNMVEITASSPTPSARNGTPRAMPRVAAGQAADRQIEAKPARPAAETPPELVIQRGRTVTRQRLTPAAAASSGGPANPSRNKDQQSNTRDDRGLDGRDALFSEDQPKRRPSQSPQKPDSSDSTPDSRTNQRPDRPIVTALTSNSGHNRMAASTHGAAPASPQRSKPAIAAMNLPTTEPGSSNEQLRSQIDSLQKMMGQVLESTRKTAVAVGTGKGDAALPSGEMPAPLFALYTKMMDNDVPGDLADRLIGTVRDRLDSVELADPIVVRQALLREIEHTIRTRSESLLNIDHSSSTGRPRVIALVGPTGVGKTTTVAKLAATYKLRHQKKVGLITSDTYRIAAVEQLRTYAGIIGLPLKVANTPEEMRQAIDDLGDCDIVVIDTAGRSPNDQRRLDELAQFAAAAEPDETHLVLSTTVGDNVLRKTAERFMAMAPDRCILTKLDEAVTTGPIAGLCDRIGLPLSFITVGQEVPDDLEPARVDRLARCVLDGPEAIVRRAKEEIG